MPLEIDMLAVGNADAIIVRTTDHTGEHVVLIDAGNSGDAEAVVNHIKAYTDRKNRIDLLISTHPHDDHIGGVPEVLDKLEVGYVLIHEPESFQTQIESLRTQLTDEELKCARKSFDTLSEVTQKIKDKSIPHCEPFAGVRCSLLNDAVLEIVGPSKEFYAQLIPEMKTQKSVEASRSDAEHVDELDDASPLNNSSVIALLTYGKNKYLFTADAGPMAFESVLEPQSVDLSFLRWMQIPHHGSRSNVNSELIQYFSPKTAYVSAKGGNGKHPSPEVVRLFQDRNCCVYGTFKGGSLWHRNGNVLDREGYVTATPLDNNAK